MTTFDKARIWLGVLFYVVLQTFILCVCAAAVCESTDPLQWDNTIQFLVLVGTLYATYRMYLLTKQKIAQLEELIDTKEEISGKLDELLDRIMRNGGKPTD